METLIVVAHVLAALGVTGLVLIQHGKGADMGASFGSGASQTMFGSVGTGNALTKSTTWLATIFFITSLVLALFAKQQAGRGPDSFLIENPEQFNSQPQQDSALAPTDRNAADLPVLPATDSQSNEEIPAAPQNQEAPVATAPESESDQVQTNESPATDAEVEDTAEDLQNATQN